MKKHITALLILGILLFSCKKGKINRLDGTYSGTFFYKSSYSSMIAPVSGAASITFDGNSYSSTGNQNKIPAGGSGTWKIISSKTIKFKDINFWTADFDAGLILDGEYNYKRKDDSLNMTKEIGLNKYEYRLKKSE